MIVKAYKYKSGLSDARRLNEHLWKRESQRPELSETRHLYAADTLAGMRVMQSLQRGSRAKIAFWHISVSPTTTLNQSDRTRVVNLIITELKAEAHPLIVVSHNDKLRARRGGGATHFHCVFRSGGGRLRRRRRPDAAPASDQGSSTTARAASGVHLPAE